MSEPLNNANQTIAKKEELVAELRAQLNNFRLLAVVVIMIVTISTWFFHVVEKWDWLDSVYYVVVTIATVGYGDYTPKTDIGKIYAIGLIIVGIATFGFFAQQLLKRQQLRALERQLGRTEKKKQT
ncbi:two pore domain potassium channel family protein [Candidatus Saccharibacteria bacterium]|nr:two pore domain potassium channel family protein [Candidatus Saccharibacteria bacterium]